MAGMGSANWLRLRAFLFRADDGVESLSAANGGASDLAPKNTNWETSDTAAQFPLRILIDHYPSGTVYTGDQALQYSLNGAPWVWMTPGENTPVARFRLTSYYANQDNSTDYAGRLGGELGYDWYADNNGLIESDFGIVGNDYTHFYTPASLVTGREMEAEWSLELVPGDVNVGDEIEFRMITDLGNQYSNGYDFLPKVTIVVSAPSITNTPPTDHEAESDYAETMTVDGGTAPKVWSLDVAPTGATINSSTGVIAWTPSEDIVGTVVDFTARVTDAVAGADTLAWQVTVTDVQLTGRPEMEPALGGRTRMEAAMGGKVEM